MWLYFVVGLGTGNREHLGLGNSFWTYTTLFQRVRFGKLFGSDVEADYSGLRATWLRREAVKIASVGRGGKKKKNIPFVQEPSGRSFFFDHHCILEVRYLGRRLVVASHLPGSPRVTRLFPISRASNNTEGGKSVWLRRVGCLRQYRRGVHSEGV